MKHFKIGVKMGISLIIFLLGNTVIYGYGFQGWNNCGENYWTIEMPNSKDNIKCEYFDYRANKNHTTRDWAFVVVADLHGRKDMLDSILCWVKRKNQEEPDRDIRFVMLLGDICDRGHGAINENYYEDNKQYYILLMKGKENS
jgi:hypothetical protein